MITQWTHQTMVMLLISSSKSFIILMILNFHLPAFARVYISKVREQLGHQESAAYIEFASVLCELHSPSGSIQETYKKMEKILSPELMEEFVIFLTPEQAALCGKEFQHFLLVRMREFFSKLKVKLVQLILSIVLLLLSSISCCYRLMCCSRFTSKIT